MILIVNQSANTITHADSGYGVPATRDTLRYLMRYDGYQLIDFYELQ